MRLIIILCLFANLAFSQCVDLHILIGQSNAMGRGEDTCFSSETNSDWQIYSWWNTAWNDYDNNSGVGTQNGTLGGSITNGLEYGFFDSYPVGEQVYIIKSPVGGSAIASWMEGETNWVQFENTYNAAIADLNAAGICYELKSIIWMQGESDSANQNYYSDVQELLRQLRFLTGASNWQFVQSANLNEGNLSNTRPAQFQIGSNYSCGYTIDLNNYQQTGDNIHLDCQGLYQLGQDIYNQLP